MTRIWSIALRKFLTLLLRWIMVAVLLYISVFLVMNLLPVDPARILAGPNAPEQVVEELRVKLGLNEPVSERFFHQAGLMLHGDLGRSFYYGEPVLSLVGRYFGRSVGMGLVALAIGILTGHFIGFLFHLRPSRKVMMFFKLGSAVPGYLLAFLALWAIAEITAITPGRNSIFYLVSALFISAVHPALALGWFVSEKLAEVEQRFTFPCFFSGLGFSPSSVRWISLRSVLPTTVAVSVGKFGYVMTTVFFCELLFNLPGFGSILLQSVYRGDVQVVAGGALVIALAVWLLEEAGNALRLSGDNRSEVLGI